MENREAKLKEYARLLVEIGLNVQKGQTVVLSAPVECADFARLCASAAYDVGCREVVMDWYDAVLARKKYLRATALPAESIPDIISSIPCNPIKRKAANARSIAANARRVA